jgi:tRNA threonylcarbamoyladenosine biosynthesis protein TsaB
MRVVALDTTTREGSAALVDGDRIVAERRGDASRTHAERLPGEILALVESEGLRLKDVDLFAVASGPGSFTGLRVGIATVQGLAFVECRRVVAVSALDALAQAGSPGCEEGSLVASWMDAHRNEVFGSLYRVTSEPPLSAARLVELSAPLVGGPSRVLEEWEGAIQNRSLLVIGDGAVRYETILRARLPHVQIALAPLLAGTIGLMAVRLAGAGGGVDAAELRPLYVRRPDAEIDREKRALAAAELRKTR